MAHASSVYHQPSCGRRSEPEWQFCIRRHAAGRRGYPPSAHELAAA